MTTRQGTIHGNTITLDTAIPPLEGKRVLVLIEPLAGGEKSLSSDAQSRLWQEWIEKGPQGPIDDEGEAEFP